MKIGLITFHFAYNYGAVLQAWAMQIFLETQGHDVDIIDYRPYYHTERYGVTRSLRATARNLNNLYPHKYLRIARGILGTVIENIQLYSLRKRKRDLFESFINEKLNTTQTCHNLQDLEQISDDFDVLIAGSDQIWNSHLTNHTFDDAYFLQFGKLDTKRIIYATSIGETTPSLCSEHVKKMNFRLNAISCREAKDAVVLQLGLQDKVDCVPDPTILLESSLYDQLGIHNVDSSGYVLLYILTPNAMLEQKAELLVDEGRKVISISPIKVNAKGVETVYPVSPTKFLSMIANADFILTNSFHGTSFSIIFERPFAVGIHGKRNERLENLLSMVGLKERLVSTMNDLDTIIQKPIDYKSVTVALNIYRMNGKNFLDKQFSL